MNYIPWSHYSRTHPKQYGEDEPRLSKGYKTLSSMFSVREKFFHIVSHLIPHVYLLWADLELQSWQINRFTLKWSCDMWYCCHRHLTKMFNLSKSLSLCAKLSIIFTSYQTPGTNMNRFPLKHNYFNPQYASMLALHSATFTNFLCHSLMYNVVFPQMLKTL